MIGVLLLALNLIFDSNTAISVCDNVDIFFLIDKDSLIHNYHGVQSIVEAIVRDGSSEEAAYSLKVYGDGLTDYQLSLQLELTDTFDTFRRNKTGTIIKRLQAIHDDIVNYDSLSDTTHNILLSDIFDVARKELQPQRENAKAKRFSAKYGVHNIGTDDDSNRYFIFSHFNKLVDSGDAEQDRAGDYEICELFNYISGHDDESIHFIMGQPYKHMKNTLGEICNNKYDDLYHDDLFFYLNKTLDDIYDDDDYENEDNDHLENLENLFHLSCPAYMEQPEFGESGHLQFRYHTQWIDSSTILKCDLTFLPDANGYLHDLDPAVSVIYVEDHLYDHNTFKKDWFLMADPLTFSEIKRVGCSEAAYRIVKIKRVKQKVKNKYFRKLKLYVELPQNPMDYMLDVDLNMEDLTPIETWNVGMHNRKQEWDSTPEYTTLDREHYGEFNPKTGTNENSESDEFYRGYNPRTDATDQKRTLLDYYAAYDEETNNGKTTKPGLFRSLTLGKHKFQKLEDIEWPPEMDLPDVKLQKQTKVKFKIPIKPKKATESRPPRFMKMRSVIHTIKSLGRSKSKQGYQKLPAWELMLENAADDKDGSETADKELWNYPWETKKWPAAEIIIEKNLDVGGIFKATALGTITAGWDIFFELKVSYKGKFKWSKLFKKAKGSAMMDVSVIGEVYATAKFDIKITAELEMEATPINVGKTIWIAAGPVPVIFKPYFRLDIKITIPKFTLRYVANCNYKSTVTFKYDYRGKKASKEAQALDIDPTKQTGTKGWGAPDIVNDPASGCTATLTLTSGDKGPCDLDIGLTVFVTPIIGVKFYYVLGIEAAFQISVPITYNVKIPNGLSFCENKEKPICEEKKKSDVTTPMYAAKYWSIDLQVTGRLYIQLPNFFGIIKQVYALRKLIAKIKDDAVTITKQLTEMQDKFTDICTGIETALEDIKDGQAAALKELIDGVDALSQFIDNCKSITKDVKTTITKRCNQLYEVWRVMDSILQDPLQSVDHDYDFGPFNRNLKEYTPKSDADCKAVPVPLKEVIKDGCCSSKGYTWTAAHQGGFSDWDYAHDALYDDYGKYRKQSLVSAPIVEPNNNNPLMALMVLDLFVIFTIFCCCTAFCGCVFGALTFYYYNKYVKVEKGGYHAV
eukprot:81257_1